MKVNTTEPVFGMQIGEVTLNVHPESQCAGEFCCIHNPSDHPLKDAPFNWRADRQMMERICKHGVGHPDRDDVRFNMLNGKGDWYGVHGCDGCCQNGSN